ncbi:hypothetical protein JW949_02950 [Candidatus Woesearchaeota archaeon]|nr:hypothetical protein [Candidatus Woesearchaeota archaeon]
MEDNLEKKINLISCKQNIGVTLRFNDKNFLKEVIESDFIKKYIPSPKISFQSQDDFPIINIKKSRLFSLSGDFPKINYQGDNLKDILFIADYFLERARQENKLYSIHSSSVEKDSKAVLLFGWKDTGKTSVALNLARNYSFNFLSEGRTVIDKDFIICGCIHYLEEDNEFLKKEYDFSEDCLYVSKLCTLSSNNKSRLVLLVYPQITQGPLEVRQWDENKSRYHMYELFSYIIRGVAKNINNYSCPLPSIDTIELAKKRSDFIKNLVDKNKIYQLRGKIEDICDEIVTLFD